MPDDMNAPDNPNLQKRRRRKYWKHLTEMLAREKSFQKMGLVHDASYYQFIGYAMAHVRQTKSQFLQDLWVLSELGSKRDGFFVEFGAASGRKFSNTFVMEKNFGWTGVLAEPNPDFHDQLKKFRDVPLCTDLVYEKSGETKQFLVHERSMFSRLADEAAVVGEDGVKDVIPLATISLNDLLERYDAPARVDYISMDVEGAEYSILKSFDFDAHRVTCFTIEAGDIDDRNGILELAEKNGYVRRWPELMPGELFLIDSRVL